MAGKARHVIVPRADPDTPPNLRRNLLDFGESINITAQALNETVDKAGDLIAPGGHKMEIGPFNRPNLAASTAHNLYWGNSSSFADSQWKAWADGSVLAFWAILNAATTAGTADLYILRGTSTDDVQIVHKVVEFFTAGKKEALAQFVKDDIRFSKGDVLKFQLATDGDWTPTTIEVVGGVGVEM